jgi:GNAT superfamily N-acetyltransferase
VSVWDQCILSKPFFHQDELALAISPDSKTVGFVHFGFSSNPSGSRVSDVNSVIHKICITPSNDEDSIARALLAHALQCLRLRGATSCTALGSTERNGFYLGISDGDNLMGVVAHDTRTQRWLNQNAFMPIRPTECWELDLLSFRPPMDRTQIGIRRTCTVGRLLDEDSHQWWMSSVLGHCEQVRFNLVLRSPPKVENELMFWYPDPTISSVDPGIMRLWLPIVPQSEEARERFVYLMAESLRQLQQDRKSIVRTYASADQQATVTLLQRLGFRTVETGLVFSQDLK